MTLKIPDDLLQAAKLDEQGLLVELACHLFDSQRLSLGQAARLAAVSRTELEDQLHDRGIAAFLYGEEELRQDIEALEKMKRQDQ